MKTFYFLGHGHFGDCWKTLNSAMRYAITHNEPVGINTSYGVWGGKIVNKKKHDKRYLFEEMIQNIDGPTDFVKFVDDIPTSPPPHSNECFKTKIVWDGNKHKKVSFQLDPCCRSVKKRSQDPILSEQQLMDGFLNLNFIKMGLPLSIFTCIQEMATSGIYVGVDSGMTHLARSVGVPVIIVRFRRKPRDIHAWHGVNGYIMVDDIHQAKEHIVKLCY